MELTILLLGYKGYQFEQDGKTVSGAKISYISNRTEQENVKGYLPVQENVELGFASQLDYPTGVYKAKLEILPAKNNSITLKIMSLSPVKEVDLTKLMVA